MCLEALRSEAFARFGDVFLVCIGADFDMVGLRPQEIFVNQYCVKS